MVNNVLARAEVEVPVVVATLVYLNRAKPHLHIALEEWANERVFLGALIVASKVSIILTILVWDWILTHAFSIVSE